MKKGAVVGIISVLGFVAALILYLSFVGEEGPQKYENYLGESQMKVLEAMYKAERAILYGDSSGKLSVYNGLIELGENGGHFEDTSCEKYKEYVVWNGCFPERGKNVLTNSFLNYFEKYFKEYLNSYPEILIPSEYDCNLIKKGTDYVPVECKGEEELKIPIVLELEGRKKKNAKKFESSDFIRPVDSITISSCYGVRRITRFHQGIDFVIVVGTPIRAVGSGVVIKQCTGYCGGYGNFLQVDHGEIISQYGHLSEFKVREGDSVNQGEVIALSGGNPGDPGAGLSTGAHLDLKFMEKGTKQNPLCYISNEGLDFSADSGCCLCEDTKNKKAGCYSGSEITGKVVSSPKKVCIDPGHVNNDRGYLGSETEGGNNLKVGISLKNILEKQGYEVFMTRDSLDAGCDGMPDSSSERTCRARSANEEKCDIFVSLHSDAGGDTGSTKAIMHCDNGGRLRDYSQPISVCNEEELESQSLAQAITENLVSLFKEEDSGWKSVYWVNSEIGAIRDHDHPTVLIEMFNHDQKHDVDIYNKIGIEKIAEAIGRGINNYFGNSGVETVNLDKSLVRLGTYKVKHNFKEEVDYNFEDYDKIIEIVKRCIGVDVEVVKSCVGSDFEWNIEEEGDYLLFDVKTDKKFPVGDKFENVVIKFAMIK